MDREGAEDVRELLEIPECMQLESDSRKYPWFVSIDFLTLQYSEYEEFDGVITQKTLKVDEYEWEHFLLWVFPIR